MSVTGLKRFLLDKWQGAKRIWPGLLNGVASHSLSVTQVYPQGSNFDRSLSLWLNKNAGAFKFDHTTPVASIGSCFAEEFARYMVRKKFNYLRSLDDVFDASANWGRVYTIPNFRQIVRYSLSPDEIFVVEECKKGWFDPLREHSVPFYPTRAEAEVEIKKHRQASRDIFQKAQRLVLTLGQNESWQDQRNNLIWARRPPQDLLDAQPDRFRPIEFSYEENSRLLNDSLEALFKLNPSLKIIASISPVPAHATFLSEQVITQSFGGKCLLRTVLQNSVNKFKESMLYFPSFEMVLADNPGHLNADNRHVQFHMVERIFRLFGKTFVP